jgi:hypothetical protein
MISSTHPKWRALRIFDEASVDYLNRLFRSGWHIVPFGIDDIEYLIMDIPANTPKRVNFKDEFQIVQERKEPSDFVVVLNKGQEKNRQMAVYVKRNETGYADMGENVPSIEVWRPIITKILNDDGMVTIYENGPQRS